MDNGEPGVARPSWMPPGDVLAAIVPAGQFLIHSERLIVALSRVSAYPNGCMLDLRASARGRDAAPGVFDRAVLAVQFGTGSTAVMWDKTAPRRLPDCTLAQVLEQYDLQGNSAVPASTTAGRIAFFGCGSTRSHRRSRGRCPSSRPTLAPVTAGARWMARPSSRRLRTPGPTGADQPVSAHVNGKYQAARSLHVSDTRQRWSTGPPSPTAPWDPASIRLARNCEGLVDVGRAAQHNQRKSKYSR
jgi:hypothetical protein